MTFSDDHGGFAFTCDDAKFSISASTWNTRLSQIGRLNGKIYVMTGLLPDANYVLRILGKRPKDVFVIANEAAHLNAGILKRTFPDIRIVLHPKNNAKVVLVEPKTVWVSSSDFGKSDQIESAVGMHSEALYSRILESLFSKLWAESHEI